jgi:hypothetical protein
MFLFFSLAAAAQLESIVARGRSAALIATNGSSSVVKE